jgi:hypothetical protein
MRRILYGGDAQSFELEKGMMALYLSDVPRNKPVQHNVSGQTHDLASCKYSICT